MLTDIKQGDMKQADNFVFQLFVFLIHKPAII